MAREDYEVVMGLEVHAELSTNTKIFCSCPTKFGAEPNTQVCPICMAMPGTLPTLNEKVVEYAVRAGLATNCEISRNSKNDRKNYFYPDLPKAYQISQFDKPLCEHGYIEIETSKGRKKIGITRIHIEEDAGKLNHDEIGGGALVDLNRAGVPLIEIVSEPDFRSIEEVDAYLKKLKSILEYIEVSDCKMQEGSFRADVNTSIRPVGSEKFGTRTEMKNMNSFRSITRALEYEIDRQVDVIDNGGEVEQETLRWDEVSGKTFSKYLSDLFEKASEICGNYKAVNNWIISDISRILNETEMDPIEIPFDANQLAKLVELIDKGTISSSIGKKVLVELFENPRDPEDIIKEKGWIQISDEGAIKEVVTKIIEANPQSVADYKAGKERALGFLVGQAMKETKGKANPQMLNKMFTEELKK